MANLKELKSRIGSVKSTQKITKAMKLVSAAKLRRAKQKAEDTFHYADRLQKILQRLSENFSGSDAPKLLVGNGLEQKKHLFIVVSSDRGLCGGFNSSLVKEVKLQANKLVSDGKQVEFIVIGKKAKEILDSEGKYTIIDYIEGLSKKKSLAFADANDIGKNINQMFEKNEFDVCTLFYNKFISTIEKEITSKQLIPLKSDIDEENSQEVVNKNVSLTGSIYEYEPSENEILEDLLPKNISVQIFNGMLENSASEHGARMTAMDNATRNAGDMIKSLTLQYNRTRQAVITSELIEIISGAEAL